jgi:hypothetical protein
MYFLLFIFVSNAPPSSLMDSNASPKVKTTKRKRVGMRSLAYSITRVDRHVGGLGWDYED